MSVAVSRQQLHLEASLGRTTLQLTAGNIFGSDLTSRGDGVLALCNHVRSVMRGQMVNLREALRDRPVTHRSIVLGFVCSTFVPDLAKISRVTLDLAQQRSLLCCGPLRLHPC
jgi:hypothetical protein